VPIGLEAISRAAAERALRVGGQSRIPVGQSRIPVGQSRSGAEIVAAEATKRSPERRGAVAGL